ncbi:MAG TPA: hypothetical protein VFM37_02070 [Pseudonocardiaceae bacterium]|nr:hypothetical protein [Pseudonocardiaceae bacterium]
MTPRADRLFAPADIGITTVEIVTSVEAVDVTAGNFAAHLPRCTCPDPPPTVYEPAEETWNEKAIAGRTHLARCRRGGLHDRQIDELINRVVASLGGKRRTELVRRST